MTLEAALRAFAHRDLAHFEGLPEGTTLEAAAAALGANPAVFGRWFLGDDQHEAFYCPADVEGYEGGVRIWFHDGVVLKIQGEWPRIDPGALAGLGDPDDRFDYRLDTLVVAGGEWVFAGRGLAVRITSTGDRVVTLSAFAPTTPARYRSALRPADDYREAPEPGGAWLEEP